MSNVVRENCQRQNIRESMEKVYLKRDFIFHVKEEPPNNIVKQEIIGDDYKGNEKDDQFLSCIEQENNVEHVKVESNKNYYYCNTEYNCKLPYIKEENIDIEELDINSMKLAKEEKPDVQKFICFICGKQSNSEYELDVHIQTTDHEREQVELSFNSDDGQDENGEIIFAEQIVKPENIDCDDEVTEKVPLITTNIEYTSEGKVYKCVKTGCEKKFFFKCLLIAHIRKHNNDRPFKCTEENCHRAFILNSELNQHMRIHNGKKSFKCSVEGCSKSFIFKRGLKTHMRSHSEKKPYRCNSLGCYRGFDTKETLLEHKLVHIEDLPFKCTFEGCTKSFSYEVSLWNHSQTHINWYSEETSARNRNLTKLNEEKIFECTFEDCTRKYNDKSKLKAHMRKHNVNKPFKCDVNGCSKAFHFNHALMSHRKRHSDDRPHKCQHRDCDKFFKCKSSLWGHMKTHQTEKLFRCQHGGCSKSFTYLKLMNDHMRVHSQESPSFLCEIDGCASKFTLKSSLYRHARKLHNRDLVEVRNFKRIEIKTNPSVGDVKIENDF